MNQYRFDQVSSKASTEQLKEAFEKQLTEIGNMVVVIDKPHGPTFLSRLWCVFEAYIADKENIPIEGTLVASAGAEFAELSNLGLDAVIDCLQVDARNASASVKEDEDFLRNLIESYTFDKVNKKVQNALMKVYVTELHAILEATRQVHCLTVRHIGPRTC